MVNGRCPRCDVTLTEESAASCIVKRKRGLCRNCNSDYSAPRNARNSSGLPARHGCLIATLRKENIPLTDELWNREAYAALIRDNKCHYCGGSLNNTGHGLDAKNNSLGHIYSNIAPCCWTCNQIKKDGMSYEEMMILSPVLHIIRAQRGSDGQRKIGGRPRLYGSPIST